jgi:hypothetical protein
MCWGLFTLLVCKKNNRWAGKLSWYSDWLRAGRSEDRIPVGGEIFRTCPDRPWGPPSLLYKGYRVFPGGKERPGRDADSLFPSSAVGHERVELYLYSPYGPYGLYRASVPVQGWPLPLPKKDNGMKYEIWNCVVDLHSPTALFLGENPFIGSCVGTTILLNSNPAWIRNQSLCSPGAQSISNSVSPLG